MRASFLAAALLFTAASGKAQDAEAIHPEADPADVATIDAIVQAIYETISGPATEERDWDRFRSLHHPDARLVPTGPRQTGGWGANVMSVEDYVAYGTRVFRDAPIFQGKGFYEVEAAQRVERYGHIAHVWSTYESRLDPAEAPFARGINSFQLLHDGERWWILSVFWQQESDDHPVPAPYLPEAG